MTYTVRNITKTKFRSWESFFDPTKWRSLWAARISTKIVIFSVFWHLFPKHLAPWSTRPNTKPGMWFCLSYISCVIGSFWIWSLSNFNLYRPSLISSWNFQLKIKQQKTIKLKISLSQQLLANVLLAAKSTIKALILSISLFFQLFMFTGTRVYKWKYLLFMMLTIPIGPCQQLFWSDLVSNKDSSKRGLAYLLVTSKNWETLLWIPCTYILFRAPPTK